MASRKTITQEGVQHMENSTKSVQIAAMKRWCRMLESVRTDPIAGTSTDQALVNFVKRLVKAMAASGRADHTGSGYSRWSETMVPLLRTGWSQWSTTHPQLVVRLICPVALKRLPSAFSSLADAGRGPCCARTSHFWSTCSRPSEPAQSSQLSTDHYDTLHSVDIFSARPAETEGVASRVGAESLQVQEMLNNPVPFDTA